MSSSFKILPAIDLIDGHCVRLKQGDYAQETRYSNDPVQTAKKWEMLGGDLLHVVDLDGAKVGRPINFDAVKKVCKVLQIDVEIGGGIRTKQDADAWFACGVKRVIIGTAAIRVPELIPQLLAQYGEEKVVLGIDAKDGFVAISGWIEKSSISAIEMAKDFVLKGIRRIIFTDIDTDGMMNGPNLNAMKSLCLSVPQAKIIASGGVSKASDIKALRSLKCANLEGAIIGRAIYENESVLTEMVIAAKELV